MNYIQSINWITTYKCNLSCHHCDIWNNPYTSRLSLDEVKKIFSSDIIQKSYAHHGDFFDVAISGWEPMLIENLEEVMSTVDELLPWSIHSISTNGTLPKRLIKVLLYWKKQWKSLRKINISLDGNQVNHDLQRGQKWSFARSIKTVRQIKKIFPEQVIELKLTITKQNYRDIIYVWKLAEKLGVFFSFKPVENMTNYTNQWSDISPEFTSDEIDKIEEQIIGNPYIEKQSFYIQTNFFKMIPGYLRHGLGEAKKACQVAKNSITIMPDGKTYWCILMNSIGSTKDNSIDELWQWEKIEKQRKEILDWECPECMLMCWSFKSKNMYEQ